MVEGTRLESVRTLKRTAGSNPALSAIERRAVPFGAARFYIGAGRVRTMTESSVRSAERIISVTHST